MRVIDTKLTEKIIDALKLNKNLQKRLNTSVFKSMPETAWQYYEVISLPTKDDAAGVLCIEVQDDVYAVPYELSVVGSKSTGRAQPIICDFCKTWQAGGRAGNITFRTTRRSLNSVSYLCCLDLKCSLHVRNMTEAAKSSRAQLREDISQHQRIQRLKDRLAMLVEQLNLSPIIDSESHNGVGEARRIVP